MDFSSFRIEAFPPFIFPLRFLGVAGLDSSSSAIGSVVYLRLDLEAFAGFASLSTSL